MRAGVVVATYTDGATVVQVRPKKQRNMSVGAEHIAHGEAMLELAELEAADREGKQADEKIVQEMQNEHLNYR